MEGGRPLATVGRHGLTISAPHDVTFNDEKGRVGIGTSDPDSTLHVSRAAKVTGLVRLGNTEQCSEDNIGSLRYQDDHKRVQICSGLRWVPVSSAPVGSLDRVAPGACDEIFHQNPALTTGSYFVRDPDSGAREEVFCERQEESAGQDDTSGPSVEERVGCTIPIAANYERYATVANNSACVIYGCTDPAADNYLSIVTDEDGSCFTSIFGCMNENAPNYNPAANKDDGTCFEMCIQSAPCASCREADAHHLASGVHWIGLSPETAMQIFCLMETGDMERDASGGGWTLLMKAGQGDTFNYESSAWTDGSPASNINSDSRIVHQDGSLNMLIDAKYNVFNWMPVTEFLAYFPAGDFYLQIGPFNTTTALEFFQQTQVLSTDPTNEPDFNPSYFSSQDEDQQYGVNLIGTTGSVRWGYSWANAAGQSLAGGGIGRSDTASSSGSFSAGDWFQSSGRAASNGNQQFAVQIYARGPRYTMPDTSG
eukprot:SAG22_NODE_1165_length_5292_cov_9.601964_3_plen_482_part_00